MTLRLRSLYSTRWPHSLQRTGSPFVSVTWDAQLAHRYLTPDGRDAPALGGTKDSRFMLVLCANLGRKTGFRKGKGKIICRRPCDIERPQTP